VTNTALFRVLSGEAYEHEKLRAMSVARAMGEDLGGESVDAMSRRAAAIVLGKRMDSLCQLMGYDPDE